MPRETIQDGNDIQQGTSQRLAVTGLQAPAGSGGSNDSQLNAAVQNLGAVTEKILKKKENEDYLEGQMAFQSGKTEQEVKESGGNRATVAGYVALDIASDLQDWQSEQIKLASTRDYATSPKEFRAGLAKQGAEMIASMGGDAFAESALSQGLVQVTDNIISAQTARHNEYIETETYNAFTNGLVASANVYSQDTSSVVNPNADGFTSYAAGIYGGMVGAESGGNRNATNASSSAAGPVGFIDSTWLQTVREFGGLDKDTTDAEILEMKTGNEHAALQDRMGVALIAKSARALSARGLPVNETTSHIAHFAGVGGATRVLNGHPDALISTTLTHSQIKANDNIMYRDGKLITNAQFIEFMAGRAPKSGKPDSLLMSVLTNPDLPPSKHRAGVVEAIVGSLTGDDATLYEGIGGLSSLESLNLSTAQKAQIVRAHTAYEDRKNKEYNVGWERGVTDVIAAANSGDFSQEEIYAQVDDLIDATPRSPEEYKRLEGAIRKEFFKNTAEDEGQYFITSEGLEDIDYVKASVLAGDFTLNEGRELLEQIGEIQGVSIADTGKQLVALGIYKDKETASIKKKADTARLKGAKVAEDTAAAKLAISENNAGALTSTTQKKIANQLLADTIHKAVSEDTSVPQESKASEFQSRYIQESVRQGMFNPQHTRTITTALSQPLDKEGNLTESGESNILAALDYHRAGDDAYLAKAFPNVKTGALINDVAEAVAQGVPLQEAVKSAILLRDRVMAREDLKEFEQSEEFEDTINTAIAEFIDQSSTDTGFWEKLLSTGQDTRNLSDDKSLEAASEDRVLRRQLEQEVLRLKLNNATTSMNNLVKRAVGNISNRTTVAGSGTFTVPVGQTVNAWLGLNSAGPTDASRAMTEYLNDALTESLTNPNAGETEETFSRSTAEGATGDTLLGIPHEVITAVFGANNPQFTVNRLGDMMTFTLTGDEFAGDAAFNPFGLLDDFYPTPAGRSITVHKDDFAKHINDKRNISMFSSVLNTVVDVVEKDRGLGALISSTFDNLLGDN